MNDRFPNGVPIIGARSQPQVSYQPDQVLVVRYENHRGEVADRRVIPLIVAAPLADGQIAPLSPIVWGECPPWHLGAQWLFLVFDLEKSEPRTLALKKIRSIRSALDPGPDRPTVVCLCGSTRFGEAFRDAMRSETLAGRIVLSVGLLGHQEGLDMEGPVKQRLDELHLRKIDMADEVLILNLNGYIGQSTRRELEYARAHGKVIRFLEPAAEPA